MNRNLQRVKSRAIAVWEGFDKHEILNLGGTIAFTTALALAPFIIILLSLSTLLTPGLEQGLNDQLVSLLGTQAADAVSAIIQAAKEDMQLRGRSGVIGLLILGVSASAIFSQLRDAFDKIDETPPSEQTAGIKGFFKRKVLSVGLVFGFIFLLIVSLFVTTLLAALFSGNEGIVWKALAFVSNILVFAALFSAMFHYIPSKHRNFKRCLISGIAATAFFLAGKALVTLYLAHSAVASAYGAAGSFVVLLIWLYYSALTLLTSYEVSRSDTV